MAIIRFWDIPPISVLHTIFESNANPAYRANLLTVFLGSCAALSVIFLCILLILDGDGTYKDRKVPCHVFYSAVCAGILFAFTPSIWEYAIQAEVFALNNLLSALLLSFTLQYLSIPDACYTQTWLLIVKVSLVTGLCISNQHTSIFYIVVCVPVLCLSKHSILVLNDWYLWSAITSGIIGLSPYIFLIARSFEQPIDSWGDQRGVHGFLRHFLRQEYGTFSLAAIWESGIENSWSDALSRLYLFIKAYDEESFHLGIPCMTLFIIIQVLYKRKTGCTVILACYVVYILMINFLANLSFSEFHIKVFARMWQQSSIIGFACIGSVFSYILSFDGAYPFRKVLPILTVLTASYCISLRYDTMDRSYVEMFGNYAVDLMKPLPPKSLLLLNDDANCNLVYYIQHCENYREDISSLRLPLLTYEWWNPMQHKQHYDHVNIPGDIHHPYRPDGYDFKQFLDSNVPLENNLSIAYVSKKEKSSRRPVYIAGPFKSGDSSQDIYQRIPVGLADRIINPDEVVDLLEFAMLVDETLEFFDLDAAIENPPSGSWELVVQAKYIERLILSSQFIAERVMNSDIRLKDKFKIMKTAMSLYNQTFALFTNSFINNIFTEEQYIALAKNAGTCSGYIGQLIREHDYTDNRSIVAGKEMFRFWNIAVESCASSSDFSVDMKTLCTEVSHYVSLSVNPLTSERFSHVKGFDFVKNDIARFVLEKYGSNP